MLRQNHLEYQSGFTVGRLSEADDCGFGQGRTGTGTGASAGAGGSSGEGGAQHHGSQGCGRFCCWSADLRQEALLDERL